MDKEKTPLLSIGIPTYNGAEHIRESLDSVINQIDGFDDEIEIVISDNASTDETPDIVKQYAQKCHFISYFRNEKNIGFDGNVDLVFARAKGKYVWVLSDDDALREGAIRRVLDILKKNKDISVCFVNYAECDINMKEYSCRIRPDLERDIYCENGDVFFQESKFLFRPDFFSCYQERKMGQKG